MNSTTFWLPQPAIHTRSWFLLVCAFRIMSSCLIYDNLHVNPVATTWLEELSCYNQTSSLLVESRKVKQVRNTQTLWKHTPYPPESVHNIVSRLLADFRETRGNKTLHCKSTDEKSLLLAFEVLMQADIISFRFKSNCNASITLTLFEAAQLSKWKTKHHV